MYERVRVIRRIMMDTSPLEFKGMSIWEQLAYASRITMEMKEGELYEDSVLLHVRSGRAFDVGKGV